MTGGRRKVGYEVALGFRKRPFGRFVISVYLEKGNSLFVSCLVVILGGLD